MSEARCELNAEHCTNLDDVAIYALGSLTPAEAARVRARLETCARCRDELRALQPATAAIGAASAMEAPGDLLKVRIMRQVRADALASAHSAPSQKGAIVWPAYLVAAAALVFAIVSTIVNLSLVGQLKSEQSGLAQAQISTKGLAKNLAMERRTLADLMNPSAKRYPVTDGEVVRSGNKLYITLHDVPTPPRGKVYQAWTLTNGASAMTPSVTFVPDRHGIAIVSLPVNAQHIGAVAVSVEPDGGSKAPTTKPILVTSLV